MPSFAEISRTSTGLTTTWEKAVAVPFAEFRSCVTVSYNAINGSDVAEPRSTGEPLLPKIVYRKIIWQLTRTFDGCDP